MKRNWIAIVSLLAMILAYELLVLGPYNRKYAETQTAATAPVTPGAPSAASPTAPASAAPMAGTVPAKKLSLTAEEKTQADKVEVNDTRFFSVYADGSVGDVVFPKYFKRGKAVKEPVRIAENGFHFSSTDPKVHACLRSFKKTAPLTFVGSAEGVTCTLNYQRENLLLGTRIGITSPTEIKGQLFFENEDGLGEGPEFDHNYLTYKKKDEDVERVRASDLWEEPAPAAGPFDFVSWGDKYFGTTLLPKGKFNPNIFHKLGSADQRVHWGIAYPLRWSAENTALTYEFDVYFTRKDLTEVKSVRADLGETIDFGFFGAIARFMLWCLESLYKIFGNYGIAIIILSLVIRLLLWPINQKMFASGQKMKDIQPQMEAIKKKYEGKTDKIMDMNQEIRALYASSGVNPLGSCFPVLIQIPIFFALNSALSNSVDLYQAPFFGWITDLSYKDPLYILPIVWTITLIISVELNPQPQSQPGMPDMKWISRVMFVVFGFISKDFPSGLNLYFLVSNVAGMLQQWLFRKKTQAAGPSILLGKER